MLKAVFFNIDGTLTDSNDFHVMARQKAFQDFGHYIEQTEIRSQIGKGKDQLVPSRLPGTDKSVLRSDVKTIGLHSGGFWEETLWNAGAPYIYGSVKIFPNTSIHPR